MQKYYQIDFNLSSFSPLFLNSNRISRTHFFAISILHAKFWEVSMCNVAWLATIQWILCFGLHIFFSTNKNLLRRRRSIIKLIGEELNVFPMLGTWFIHNVRRGQNIHIKFCTIFFVLQYLVFFRNQVPNRNNILLWLESPNEQLKGTNTKPVWLIILHWRTKNYFILLTEVIYLWIRFGLKFKYCKYSVPVPVCRYYI